MNRLEEKISYYVNRRILVANPEFYVYEDCRIINSIIVAFDVKQHNFAEFCEIIDFPHNIEAYFSTDIKLDSSIRPIFNINKCTNITGLEMIHYRYVYKKVSVSKYRGAVILCADGKAYEYNAGELVNWKGKKQKCIEWPVLIYWEEDSFSVLKDEKKFYKLLNHMRITYIKCDEKYSFLYQNVKATALTKEEYDLASRVIDDGFELGKRKDLIYYYANRSCAVADNKIDDKCYKFFVKNDKKYWCERTYEGCNLKFRYTIEDFFINGLGICADTASICNVLFNDFFGIKTYILTLRGHNIRHAVCVLPQIDMIISNMCFY